MTSIIIFLPYRIIGKTRYFHMISSSYPLISGCRSPGRVKSSDAGPDQSAASNGTCSFQSGRLDLDWLLRELPDGDERAQNQEQIDYHLEYVAALLFRANQKRVSGFVLVIRLPCHVCFFFHDLTSPSLRLAAMTSNIKFLPQEELDS